MRVAEVGTDWAAVSDSLWDRGYALIPRIAPGNECQELAALYDDDSLFRSRVSMERYNFGRGAYAYFANPLPPFVQKLRTTLYEHLAPLANEMNEALGEDIRYPTTLQTFETVCAEHGQTKPTPLLLRYGVDDYNCLHRDLYGDIVFPMQAMVQLSRPSKDFEGGEFVLVENRPRQQSRAEVINPQQGDLVIFFVNQRPARTPRGVRRLNLRHGVSRVTKGERTALGIIFHNAR